jgi:hypothetical protein
MRTTFENWLAWTSKNLHFETQGEINFSNFLKPFVGLLEK